MKILRRILIGIVGLILALIVLVVGSIFVDGLFGQGRLDALTNSEIAAADGTVVRAYVAKPTTPGPHPAVIMIHEFYGLRPEILGKADALAKEGYLVIAPSVFRTGTTNWIPSAIYKVITAEPAQIDGDVDAVFKWLETQTDVAADRIAIMGFCFGGGTSIRYSTQNPRLAATVIFYGQPISDPAALKGISGPVLGIFGGADGSIPVAEVKAMEAKLSEVGVKNEITIYEGQPHAFVTSMEEIAKGGVQQEAWNQLLTFLKANLQSSATIHNPKPVATNPASFASFTWGYILRVAIGHLAHGMI